MATKCVGGCEMTSDWLRQALHYDGLTMEDVATKYNVKSQYIGQIAKEWGIDPHIEYRDPMWFANKIGKPELGNKNWVLNELKKVGGLKALAEKLDVGLYWMLKQVKRLGVTTFAWVEYKTGECAFCHEPITRPSSYLNDDQIELFCDETCYTEYRRGRPRIRHNA